MAFANESKNSSTFANEGFGGGEKTWDEMDVAWDDTGESTWDATRDTFANETKNSSSFANESKN